VFSDISQGQCTQQGVAQGVNGHISVRMGNAPDRAFHLYTSKPQWQSFRQGMDIISVTYSYIHNRNNFNKYK
jgi:hypothetical protein